VSGKTLDFIAVGRAGIDLYGQQAGGRLEDMGSFAKYIGGSPTNTAIGGARLGLKTALLTRVGADHLGRFITEELAREGVETGAIVADPDRPTALVILGIRDRDTFPLLYFRENCADMALSEADVDEALIARSRAVVLSGTHFSHPGVMAMSLKAARTAKASGGQVVLDVDFRPVLWGLTAREAGELRFVADNRVTRTLQAALPLCDLVVGTEEELHILGGTTDTIAALKAIRDATDALLVCKRGPLGCSAFPGAIPLSLDDGVVGQGFPVEVFNVLGAGDAFMAGFLRGWLRDERLEICCELANACGAIVVSRHGCAPAMPTWPELEYFRKAPSRPTKLREWADLEHLHWATTRSPVTYERLLVFAVDHRWQLEALAQEAGAPAERIGAFKSLALRALHQVAAGDPTFGLLIDGRFGADVLAEAAAHPYWLGRPVEQPRSRPLAFERPGDVAADLLEWPLNQVAKCLVLYHPDDEPDLLQRQQRQLVRLADACRATRHELLVEIILPKDLPADAATVSRALQQIYDLGVRPDWWKLEPAADTAAWRNIEAVIQAGDPYCRGVLILGLSAPIADLAAAFKAAAGVPVVRGFAVGRTIFTDAAPAWFAGRISDEAAVAAMAGQLRALVQAWNGSRG
jgi:5-dehydro-2-deoxygluconokinase